MNKKNSNTDKLVLAILCIGMAFVAISLYQLGHAEAKMNVWKDAMVYR